jgi:hypothetical protein
MMMQKRLFEIMRRNRQKMADNLARLRIHDERLCALNLEAAFRGMPPPCDGASNYVECLRGNVQTLIYPRYDLEPTT